MPCFRATNKALAIMAAVTTLATFQLAEEGPVRAIETLEGFVVEHPEHAYLRIQQLNLLCRIAPEADNGAVVERLQQQLPTVNFTFTAGTMLSQLFDAVVATQCSAANAATPPFVNWNVPFAIRVSVSLGNSTRWEIPANWRGVGLWMSTSVSSSRRSGGKAGAPHPPRAIVVTLAVTAADGSAWFTASFTFSLAPMIVSCAIETFPSIKTSPLISSPLSA